MFKSTRHTLRASHRSGHRSGHRSTLKQQKGGASLQSLCAWRTTDPKETKWNTLLENTPFSFLLEDKWTKEQTSLTQYTMLVERQDELFMLSIDAIYAELGANKNDEADILSKYEAFDQSNLDTLTDYIKDIAYIINLSDITGTGAKFAEILTTDKEPLLHLLLNPLRVQNHFIYNLAYFIKHLKENPITAFDETKAGLMAIRYDSLAKANTLNLTSTDLRDGPILNMKVSNVISMLGTNKGSIKDSFWYKFLMFCHSRKIDFTMATSDYKTYIEGFSWSSDILINNKKDSYAKFPLLASYIYMIYTPTKGEMGKEIQKLNKITKNITESEELKFLHHLIYSIESLTPSEAQTSSQENVESTV